METQEFRFERGWTDDLEKEIRWDGDNDLRCNEACALDPGRMVPIRELGSTSGYLSLV